MDLSTLTTADSDWTPAPRGRKAEDKGPNPFVVNDWLMDTFHTGKAKAVTVTGEFVEEEKKDRKGNPVTRRYVRGDAGEVIKLLRAAGDELKIGVTLNPVAGRKRGTITIHYLGIKRKAPRKTA